jgi:acetyl esterase/lipase
MGAGISNWLSFHGNSVLADWDAMHLKADPYEKDGAYQRFSAINYAKRIQTPTLILHGEKDGDVPPEQSYQFFRALKDHKVETSWSFITKIWLWKMHLLGPAAFLAGSKQHSGKMRLDRCWCMVVLS